MSAVSSPCLLPPTRMPHGGGSRAVTPSDRYNSPTTGVIQCQPEEAAGAQSHTTYRATATGELQLPTPSLSTMSAKALPGHPVYICDLELDVLKPKHLSKNP
ncbi:hypothetical protein JOB18_036813 [Solea senegalensis]|uniref:Uncharacterized protein n=1 Tax=Solea senegalensis TaxID=28829 RepID=A0AAV6PFB0_SOLSE|nr:hypothetical protein JOB18_036813 [Solea senegalensis]